MQNSTFLREKSKKVGVAGGPGSCKWLYNSNVLGAPGAGGPSRDPIYPIFTDFNGFQWNSTHFHGILVKWSKIEVREGEKGAMAGPQQKQQ